LLYASDNGGRFPYGWNGILKELGATTNAKVLVCPCGQETAATAADLPALLRELAKPRHVSYVYCGAGLGLDAPVDAALAYEANANHDGRINVLFADGHVDLLGQNETQQFLKAAANRQGMLRWRATLTTTGRATGKGT
jgi:prepilin-type processing-associated H-X9-DG protein